MGNSLPLSPQTRRGSSPASAAVQPSRASIEWSYQLCSILPSSGRGLRGRIDAAAEAVCNPPGTLTLAVRYGHAAPADQSFVQLDSGPDGVRWFTMLETIRAYAQERLDAGGAAVLSAALLNAR